MHKRLATDLSSDLLSRAHFMSTVDTWNMDWGELVIQSHEQILPLVSYSSDVLVCCLPLWNKPSKGINVQYETVYVSTPMTSPHEKRNRETPRNRSWVGHACVDRLVLQNPGYFRKQEMISLKDHAFTSLTEPARARTYTHTHRPIVIDANTARWRSLVDVVIVKGPSPSWQFSIL